MGQLIAGPFCGKILAEFGAEVIKIEPPASTDNAGGDPLRTWRQLHNGTSLWWSLQARNKKSAAVNLRVTEGQEIIRKLAKNADILIENFRPGALEKWRLGWEPLSAINPKLIMVRLSGYGQTGPYKDRPGFGLIGEAMGGIRYITGYPDRAPVRVGVSLGDAIAAMYGAMGALMALHHRNVNGGKGQVVDVALYEAVFSLMESMLPEFGMTGYVRERTGSSLPGIVPSNSYTTKDGKYVVIGGNGDSIFKRFMHAIGHVHMANDPALANNAGRAARTDDIEKVIGDWCAEHDLAHVLRVLEQAEVPSGSIYSIQDIVRDVHYQARDMIEKHKLNDSQDISLPGIVPKLSETPGETKWLGPKLGEHTREILQALGYSDEQQTQLRNTGVIG
ncbi:MAG: CoA transferase [Pseudomonadota bacterium]|nr:CoA transferase [Pseudomonadota bacterium]